VSAGEGLADRVARLEDRVGIQELVARYGFVVDDRDIDALAGLFTPDGCFRSVDGVIDAHGRDAVIETFHGRYAALSFSLHVAHDHIITFDPDDPDHATGLLGSHAEVHRNGRTMVAALRYEDSYRRHEGRWRFADRLLSFLYYVPVEEYARALGALDRMRAYDAPRPADLPERTASWQAYARRFAGR